MAIQSVTHCLHDASVQKASASTGGLLIGWQAGPTADAVTVLDLAYIDATQAASELPTQALKGALPQGLRYVGVFGPSKDAAKALAGHQACKELLAPASPDGSASAATQMLAAVLTNGACQYSNYDHALGTWQDVPVNQATPRTDLHAWSQQPLATCSVIMTTHLDVYTPTSGQQASAQLSKQHIEAAANVLRQQLRDTCNAFLVTSRGGKQVLVSDTPSTQGHVSDLVMATSNSSAASAGLASVSLQAQPLSSPAAAAAAQTADSTVDGPVFQYQVASGAPLKLTRIPLSLTALAYIPVSAQLRQLAADWLLPALLRAVDAAAAAVAEQSQPAALTSYTFLPPGRSHHVTLFYPSARDSSAQDKIETSLTGLRKRLHQALGLPPNRPCLRLANAITTHITTDITTAQQQSAAAGSQRLRDVHIGLSCPVSGGEVALIDGSYDYYHYMQDRFNDNGWGCAYRSLQTLASWFRIQHYTTIPVPTHKEIQQTLVKVGDKTPDFVGTNNWIGAIELSYVLDELLGITSKIITVNRGADIPSYARQLAAHFTSQGTPIMIGGGVLAYTLLGVAFNEQTGECAFLILDPHYTGGEDLRKIHQGSWVAWKKLGDTAAAGGPLFVPDAFYNFLCPQRPNMV